MNLSLFEDNKVSDSFFQLWDQQDGMEGYFLSYNPQVSLMVEKRPI